MPESPTSVMLVPMKTENKFAVTDDEGENVLSDIQSLEGGEGGGEVDESVALEAPTPEELNSLEIRASRQRFCLGWMQLSGLLRKHACHKYRTPVSTLMELLSPVLMMLVLVLAYSLSEVTYKPEQNYSSIVVNVTPWIDILREPVSSNLTGNRRLHEAIEDEQVRGIFGGFGADQIFDWGRRLREIVVSSQDAVDSSYRRRLQAETNGTEGLPSTQSGSSATLDSLRVQIRQFLDQPILIPSMDAFVALSKTLSSLVDVNQLPSLVAETRFGRQWGNLLTLGTLHVVDPSYSFIDFLNTSYPNSTSQLVIRSHNNTKQALDFIQENLLERTWALLDLTHLSDSRRYEIRMNYTTLPDTNQIVNYVAIGLDTTYYRYYLSGYLTLQRALNEFLFATEESCTSAMVNASTVWSMPMPTAAYSQNSFFLAVGYLLGLTLVLAFLYPTSRLVKLVVEEKETRMKETLMIFGVRGWAYWSSWLILYLVIFVVIAVLSTLTLSSSVLQYSSPWYIVAWIGLFGTACIGFCFFLASLFNRAKLAAVVGPMALFATILPRFIFFGTNRYQNVTAMRWASLLPGTAFAFGADIVADYEYAQQGIQSWNADEGPYSFDTSLGFLLLDTSLYLLLGFYLDAVMPRQYGTPYPFYFIVSPWYWFGSCLTQRLGRTSGKTSTREVDDPVSSSNNEAVDGTLLPRIQMRGLTKRYGRMVGGPVAVDKLELTLYESQITALLGHNGAGKTTLISMLTGLLPPTSGDCVVYGSSIVHETTAARASVGICPQQNTLFDRLTVYEHIALFQRLKGIRPTASSVASCIEELGLADYVHTTTDALSGGNKRKLSVAIALSGDPKFLVLDEPTSGMDPRSRRACWDVLRRKRAGRVILMTTHFMDEAEFLSDRVVVVKEGALQCSGSPLFLKQRFGLGYNLTFLKNWPHGNECGSESARDPEALVPSALSQQTDSNGLILELMQRHVPAASVVRSSEREVVIRVPKGSESVLPHVFEYIEVEKDRLGIGAWGVESSSLEEIFILLWEHSSDEVSPHTIPQIFLAEEPRISLSSNECVDDEAVRVVMNTSPDFSLFEDAPIDSPTNGPCFGVRVSDISLENSLTANGPDGGDENGTDAPVASRAYNYNYLPSTRQVGLLYWKRFVIQRRDITGLFFLVVAPLVLVALVLCILTINVPLAGPAIELSPALYEPVAARGSGSTDVDIVGGASIKNETLRDEWLVSAFTSFKDILNPLYSLLDFRLIAGVATSAHLSTHFLDTYNSRDHNIRLAAFAFDDSLESTLTVDRNGMVDLMGNLGATSLLRNDSDIILQSILEGFLDLGATTILGNPVAFLGASTSPNGTLEALIQIQSSMSILHNSSSAHSVASFNQAYAESLYRICSNRSLGITSVNHPLPLTVQQTTEVRTILSILASLFVLIPYCYVPGAYVVFIVKEKMCKSTHVQLVSGASPSAYWLANYLWDVTMYLIFTLLVMAIFLIFGSPAAVVFVGGPESFLCTFLLTLGYGLSILPFAYLIAQGFDNHSSAQIAVIGVVFVTGFVAVNAYFIMSSIESTKHIATALRPLFRIWPAYDLGDGLIQMASAYWQRHILGEDVSPFDWSVAGKPLALLYSLTLPYSALLLFLQYRNEGGSFLSEIGKRWESLVLRMYGVRTTEGEHWVDDGLDARNRNPDEDVESEMRFVKSNLAELKVIAPILLVDLWKIYPPSIGLLGTLVAKTRMALSAILCCWSQNASRAAEFEDRRKAALPKRALRGVTTAVHVGETYALLGQNGAGKTTTIGVLTGETSATAGTVYVAGHEITAGGLAEARKHIGLCPQVDPLLENMSGRETLRLFARLRGTPLNRVNEVVDLLIDRLTLSEHADKTTEKYSGGNKRKLSLGIALIGDPKVLLIDEPSTGLDPVAKRKGMWSLISEVSKDRSVILTTHSMEEAEALCTRAGVMVDGQLLCLGAVQHLKAKYGDGYTVDIIFHPKSDMEAAVVCISSEFPFSKVLERHGRFLRLSFGSENRWTGRSLGQMLSKLYAMRERSVDSDRWKVEDYSISQTSLEQVFLLLSNTP